MMRVCLVALVLACAVAAAAEKTCEQLKTVKTIKCMDPDLNPKRAWICKKLDFNLCQQGCDMTEGDPTM